MKKFNICLLIIILCSPLYINAKDFIPKTAKDLANILPSDSEITYEVIPHDDYLSIRCYEKSFSYFFISYYPEASSLVFSLYYKRAEGTSINNILKILNVLNSIYIINVSSYNEKSDFICLKNKIYVPPTGAPLDYLQSNFIRTLSIFDILISQMQEEDILS